MAHELSTTNGITSFADSRAANGMVDAWHKLGTPVGHVMTAQEVLDAAYLANWNVRKRPLWADIRDDMPGDEDNKGVVVPDQYATVFDNPVTGKVTPIGVVGKRYTPIQNEALTTFADTLVDESGAHYETGGAMRDYSQVFITMKLPREMKLQGLDGKIDTTEYYLALFNSHDGSSSMFGLITSVRVVCANTAAAAIKGAKSRFKIRHTADWQAKIQEAREQLRLVWDYEDAFEAEARGLFEQPFGNNEMDEFLKELVELDKVDPKGVAATKRRNEMGAIKKLWVSSPAIVGTPVAGTKFGAFQAVTEYVDHYASVRSNGDESVARATRTLLQASAGGGLKDDAWRLLTTV